MNMPIVSQFYGIKITMFYDDHGEPHFHVYYAEYSAKISIKSGKIIAGSLPKRAQKLISEWMSQYTDDLMENWKLAKEHKVLQIINPLK